MPQPLNTVIRTGAVVHFNPGLPLHKPKLYAHAMNIISIWAMVERETAVMTVSFTLGKSAPIAELLMDSNSEAQRKAI